MPNSSIMAVISAWACALPVRRAEAIPSTSILFASSVRLAAASVCASGRVIRIFGEQGLEFREGLVDLSHDFTGLLREDRNVRITIQQAECIQLIDRFPLHHTLHLPAGIFPVGRKRERVTTRRERTLSAEEKAIRSTGQSVAPSSKSWVDRTRPYKSVSRFIINHQPHQRSDRK
jgi:hypothetical protein